MREVPEWIGKTDDTPAPPRVRLRVFEKDKGICQCGCGIKINGKPWDTDHIVAIINGGENRESNLRTLLRDHHKIKTAADVAEKARVVRKRMASIGLKVRRGPPMPGSRASGWKRKMNGEVVRR
jgi:5-methylcytosine-specific restriction protein A